jgi:hypothetical protein
MKCINIRTLVLVALILGMGTGVSVHAQYSAEELPDKQVFNDFVVGPGKVQLDMRPGETVVKNIILSNRMGTDRAFKIEIEDIAGTRDVNQSVVLLAGERGPYSLKDYINVASTTFFVDHAERVTIPVTIHVPSDAQPGGLYGSVVISTISKPASTDLKAGNASGKSAIVTRIGTLFFIRVAGDVKEDASLVKFSLTNDAHFISAEEPVSFRLLYENNGTIHENPYGYITVSNIFGSSVAKIPVEPWFALPNSLRLREVTWDPKFIFGRYKAVAEINRGYGDIIDTKELTFWVIPWKLILGGFAGLVVIFMLLRWIFSKFTISVKR